MKNLKLFTMVLVIAGITGCISVERGPEGPRGPKGEPGATEKVIVVPENKY